MYGRKEIVRRNMLRSNNYVRRQNFVRLLFDFHVAHITTDQDNRISRRFRLLVVYLLNAMF